MADHVLAKEQTRCSNPAVFCGRISGVEPLGGEAALAGHKREGFYTKKPYRFCREHFEPITKGGSLPQYFGDLIFGGSRCECAQGARSV